MGMELNKKLTAYREEEVEKRSRVSTLASIAKSRELNSDESAELDEIQGRLAELQTQQRNVQRLLEIGDFHPDSGKPVGLNDKEKRQYSILALIRALDPKATQRDRDAAGFELEVSSDIGQKLKQEARGAYLPFEIPSRDTRDLKADTFTGGGALVGVDYRPPTFIELMRNRMAVRASGATILDGLVGDVAIPKQTGGATAYWVGLEGGALTESTQAVSQVALTPRTLGAFTDYTRNMKLQSSISVENFIRNDLATVLALEEDRAALHGSGSSGEPVGIANVTGIGTQSFSTASTPTRAEVIGMRKDLATANAMMGNLGFITNSTIYSNMLNTAVDTGSGIFLLNENGTLLGRQCLESNQVASGKMFFGNWADLLIGTWGNAIDVLVDPYTASSSGTTRVIVFLSVDLAVRHAESFCLGG